MVASNILTLPAPLSSCSHAAFDNTFLSHVHTNTPIFDADGFISGSNTPARSVVWLTTTPFSIESLWHKLHHAQHLPALLSFEASLLSPCSFPPIDLWREVLDSLATCITHVTALQTAIVEGTRCYGDQTMLRFWASALIDMQWDFAIMAASLATCERFYLGLQPLSQAPAPAPALLHADFDPDDAVARRRVLNAHVLAGFRRYWQVVLTGKSPRSPFLFPCTLPVPSHQPCLP